MRHSIAVKQASRGDHSSPGSTLSQPLQDLIRTTCERAWARASQRFIPIGAAEYIAPAGWNGPYFDLESPIRNTSHWAVVGAVLCAIHGKESSIASITGRLLAYLSGGCERVGWSPVWQRSAPGKDRSNGVIGLAWLLEALYTASMLDVSRNEATEYAVYVVDQYLSYVASLGLWAVRDTQDGRYKLDYTFNHQAWLAASIAELSVDHPRWRQLAGGFLDACADGVFATNSSGLIKHVAQAKTPRGVALSLRHEALKRRNSGVHIAEREDGYHLYNLFAFARLRECFPAHRFFRSDQFLAACALVDEKWLRKLDHNRYSMPYNAPGYELPLIFRALSDLMPISESAVIDAVERQDRFVSGAASSELPAITDPLVLEARTYELALALRPRVMHEDVPSR